MEIGKDVLKQFGKRLTNFETKRNTIRTGAQGARTVVEEMRDCIDSVE